jgi:hypothetical protein
MGTVDNHVGRVDSNAIVARCKKADNPMSHAIAPVIARLWWDDKGCAQWESHGDGALVSSL